MHQLHERRISPSYHSGCALWYRENGMTDQTPLLSTATPRPRPRPPLLALPVELQLEVFSYLSDTNASSLITLRRTHSSFRPLIPLGHFTSLPPVSQRAQLLIAEDHHAYLFPPDGFPCYGCRRVLPGSTFDVFYTMYAQGCTWSRRMEGCVSRGGIRKGTRRCRECLSA